MPNSAGYELTDAVQPKRVEDPGETTSVGEERKGFGLLGLNERQVAFIEWKD